MKSKAKISKSEFERVPTGIPGLDNLIEGGLIKGSTTLVSGGAGTGKTILCLQFIKEGLRRGENGMFLTLEEQPKDLLDDVKRFGWDFSEYIKRKEFIVEYKDPFQVTDITSPLLDKIKEHRISRVVVDSTSVMGLYFKDAFEVRKQLFKLLSGLKSSGVTCIMTAELPEETTKLSRFGVEEFIVDGLIILRSLGLTGEFARSLRIVKMRRTKHEEDVHSMEISKEGIKVLPTKRGFKI
jgi:circadian clock protein KaiC